MGIDCTKCGIKNMNAASCFWLMGANGTYDPFCKTCIRPAIRVWNLPSDLTNLDDAELRRKLDAVNIMVYNRIYSDPARLRKVFDHMQNVMSTKVD